jgi:hypothetical protein
MRKLMSSLANVSVLESLKLALEQKPPLSEEVSAQSVLFCFVFLLSHLKSTGRTQGNRLKRLVEMSRFLMFDIFISVHPHHLPDTEELAFR